MLINVDYTVTYFLPIPSTVLHTRARSELLNVSLVSPCVEFYTALPVSIDGHLSLYKTLIYLNFPE